MKPKSTLRSFLALAGSSLLAISSSHAQSTYTWANSNITATPASPLDWLTGGPNTQGTWTGGTPVSGNLNTIRFFDNTTTNLTHTGNPSNQTANLNNGGSAFQLGTLTLSGRASATNNAKLNLTISGDALNFSAATGTINLDALNVDADQLVTHNLNSNIQLGTASSAGALTLTGNGTSVFNIGGIISELQVGGGSLIKSGSSTVSLTGANSYTGTTTLNGGTLVFSDANVSLASSTGITLNGGGLTLINAVGQHLVDRVSNSAVITSNGGTITWTNPNGDNTADWAETLGALSLTTGQTNIVSTNAVNAARTQVLTLGAGSLTHAASNTSAITFSGASLGTGTVNNIVITSLGDTAANGIIGPWATYGTSAAAQTDYATYNITAGATNAFGIQGAAIAASDQSSWTTAANVYTANAGASTGGSTGLSGTRTIAALRSISGANAMTVDNVGNTFSLASNTFANGDAFILGGTAPAGLVSGNTYFVVGKFGDTFQLESTLGGGAIDFTTNGTSVTAAGAITLSSGNNLETYGLLNGVATTMNVVRTGTGVLTTPSGGGNLYLTTGSGGITISAPIADNGAVTVVKNGTGTLTLSGTNTYSGATAVNADTLTIGGGGTLGSGNYGGNISIANGGVLNFANSVSQTLSGNIANNGTLTFTSSGSGSRLYVVSGNISGSGSVNIIAAANTSPTLTLSGNNTYTGTTSFGMGNIIGTATLSVSSFDYITNGSYANHGLGSSLGAPTTPANGTITIGVTGFSGKSTTAVLNYTGPGETTDRVLAFAFGGVSGQGLTRTIDASGSGLLKFTSPFTITTLPTAGQNTTFALSGTGLGEVAAGITDLYAGLPVTKSGTGTWTLSANNTYTGATTITAGTLNLGVAENVNVSGPLGKQLANAAGTIVLTGGTLQHSAVNTNDYSGRFSTAASQQYRVDTNGQNVTWATALTSSGGTLTKSGLGTLTLTNTNTYTGATSVNGGTLQLISGAGNLTQSLGALAFAGADGTLESNKSGAGDITTNFSAFTARTAGNTGNIKSTGGTNGTDNTVNITGAAGFIDKGIFFGGSEFAARNATDTYVRALNYATSGGDTNTVDVDTITASRHVKLTSTPANQNTIALLSLNLQGITGVNWTNNAAQILTCPGIIKSGGGSQSTISGGNLTAGSNIELVIRTDTSSDALAISSNLTQGSGALTKSGAGTLTLSGTANTYSGATNVNGGTLALGASNVLSGGAVTIHNATLDAATFTDTVGTLDPAAAATINFGSGGALAFNNSNAVSWTGGTLNLTGTLNFSGGSGSSLRFGTTNTGLTATQLGLISASGYSNFGLDADGYLTAVSGGSAPEIAVDQSGNINTGGSKAFGTVTIGSPTSLIFTINNTGNAALNLTGTPRVSVTGDADFTVTAQPTASVAGPGNTTFTVQFAPSASGARNAVLSIANNDTTGSENPFTINVSGTGQTPYEAWALGGAFNADANGDGVKNGLAFLLGATDKNASALNKLPTVTKDISGNLIMTFQCLKDASRGSSTLNVEHSSNLGISDAWLGAPVTDAGATLNNVSFSIGSASATLNNVTATISNTEAVSGKLFGRLQGNNP